MEIQERVVQKRVLISGRVQGVGFRASTCREARLLGKGTALRGFVRNLPDGRVEAVFRGPENLVNVMVEWCSHGPRFARVDRVEVRDETLDPHLPEFEQA